MSDERDSWSQWSKYVLKEQERHSSELSKVHDSVDGLRETVHSSFTALKVEITSLKVRASAWGAMAGILATAVPWLVDLISKRH